MAPEIVTFARLLTSSRSLPEAKGPQVDVVGVSDFDHTLVHDIDMFVSHLAGSPISGLTSILPGVYLPPWSPDWSQSNRSSTSS